jgi:hypothetical protein
VRVEWIANPSVGDASDASFTIAAPYVTVTKPNGGENWASGSTQAITWANNLGSKEYVRLELSTDGGGSWSVLVASTPSDGSQAIVVPSVSSSTCRVRVTWLDNPAVSDTSNANFSTGPAFLTLTAPNGGETWLIGLSRAITWSSSIGGNVSLKLSTDGGASWSTLASSTANDGSYSLTVPNLPTTQARMRVDSLAAGFTAYTDTSNANFTIAQQPYVALFTAGGEVTGANYARKPTAIDIYEGRTGNIAIMTWGPLTEPWGTGTEMKLFAAASGGDPLYAAALRAPVVMRSGYYYRIYAGAIRFPEAILDTALLDEALLDQAELGTALLPVELRRL